MRHGAIACMPVTRVKSWIGRHVTASDDVDDDAEPHACKKTTHDDATSVLQHSAASGCARGCLGHGPGVE